MKTEKVTAAAMIIGGMIGISVLVFAYIKNPPSEIEKRKEFESRQTYSLWVKYSGRLDISCEEWLVLFENGLLNDISINKDGR